MICKNCNYESNSKFCPECGTKMEANITNNTNEFDNNHHENVSTTTIHTQITCYHCGEMVNRDSIYCPFCHKMILHPLTCKKCGTENDARNIYCTKCHYQIQEDPNIENEHEQSKSYLKIGIACLSAIIMLIIIAVSCSYREEIEPVGYDDVSSTIYNSSRENEEETIEQYIKSNVENMEYCSATLQDNKALIMCTLNKEMQDSKSNYYSFAESIVNATKIISKEYNLSFVNVNVYFFIDADISILWQTTDFGKSGTFTEKDDINNYKNVKYYSLSGLKQYLSKYN